MNKDYCEACEASLVDKITYKGGNKIMCFVCFNLYEERKKAVRAVDKMCHRAGQEVGMDLSELEDSGKRETYASGCVREPQNGKGRYDLIGTEGLRRLALVYELGSKKYAERNWEKGGKYSRNLCSALRHLVRWMAGERGEDHLAMCCWNLFAIMEYEKTYRAGDDMSKNGGRS